LFLILTAVAALPSVARSAPAPIPWRAHFESAWTEAQARNRPLWVQFTGPWCIFCKKMDYQTFTQPDVIGLSRDDFIPVKVRSDEREDLTIRFGVGGLPSTVILAPDGRVLGRREGFVGPTEFLGFLFSCRPRTPPIAPATPEIALAGYDVVNLVSGRGLRPGEAAKAVQYDGMEFRFLDDAERDAFLKEPEKYLPAGRGRCAVQLVDQGASVPGDPRFGVYYKGRLFLCANEEMRQRFAADPNRYADADLGDAGHCPHCREQRNLLVRGQPEYGLSVQGRHYLFPDATHLQAFRDTVGRLVR
jgi:YHS domain-containing protein/thiol-disulfide isomerase/thioredoxin